MAKAYLSAVSQIYNMLLLLLCVELCCLQIYITCSSGSTFQLRVQYQLGKYILKIPTSTPAQVAEKVKLDCRPSDLRTYISSLWWEILPRKEFQPT